MSTSMREALKPCPFCGSKSLTLTVNEHHWKIVECDDCGMRGPCIDLEDEEYLARWNTRAALSSPAPDRLSEEERYYALWKASKAVCDSLSAVGDSFELVALRAAIKSSDNDCANRLSRQPEAEPVAWIEFADNGNIRFWTSDPARAWTEGDNGRPLRKFTLAELVALAASPRLDREKVAEWVNSRVELAAEIAERHLGKSEAEYIASDIRGLKLSVGIMRETRS